MHGQLLCIRSVYGGAHLAGQRTKNVIKYIYQSIDHMPNNRPQLIARGADEVAISKPISPVEHRTICKNHNIWFRLIEMSVFVFIFCPSICHWVSLSRSYAWLSMTFQILYCRFHKLIFTLSRFGLIDLNPKMSRNLRIYSHEFRTTHWMQTWVQTEDKFRKSDNRFGRFWYLFGSENFAIYTAHASKYAFLFGFQRTLCSRRSIFWLVACLVCLFYPFFRILPLRSQRTQLSRIQNLRKYILIYCVYCVTIHLPSVATVN